MRRHHLAAQRQVTREVAFPDQSSVLLAQSLQAHAPGPIQQLCQGEQVAKVHHALALLPELDREILLMRHVEDLPYEDIGHILGMEAATARKRYGRALLRLRKAFFADGEGTSDA
jgi:RNA polymerase sigma-70 factor (ECF subfamily)